MRRPRSLFRHFGFHLLLLAGGVALFCWPFVGEDRAREAGTAFSYLLVAWGFFIVVLFVAGLNFDGPDPGSGDRPEETGRDV